MKMWGPSLKNYLECQDGDSRTFKQAWLSKSRALWNCTAHTPMTLGPALRDKGMIAKEHLVSVPEQTDHGY